MFLAFGAGAICFFISLFSLFWLGTAIGFVRLDLFNFGTTPKRLMDTWEIVILLVSLALSILASELVFRSCKKYIAPGNPPL
jgi:hypothetical protein